MYLRDEWNRLKDAAHQIGFLQSFGSEVRPATLCDGLLAVADELDDIAAALRAAAERAVAR